MEPNDKPLLTGDVARLLGVSAERVRELGNAGVLRYSTTASRRIRLYDGNEVRKIARERAERAERRP
jgi:DNA-binding transcriptional MerR regulator